MSRPTETTMGMLRPMIDPATQVDAAQGADANPPALPARGGSESREPARWQAAVARRSAESRATVPDIDLSVTVDMDASLALAGELSSGLTALYLRACALALREHPQANAAYRDGRFEQFGRVNVGVLIAQPDAYVIPTVFDADSKSVAELAEELAALEQRALAGELLAPELSGATFTLSDLGPLGVTSSTPLIVPPQAAAISAGTLQTVPIVQNGAIVPGHMTTLTLASDHRILYGAAAAAFLLSIKSRLQEALL
jgi:pyruvate dehydrogenase E2 component (dihydrolipoamide acetyltransferase)